jgi:hypothetical protein
MCISHPPSGSVDKAETDGVRRIQKTWRHNDFTVQVEPNGVRNTKKASQNVQYLELPHTLLGQTDISAETLIAEKASSHPSSTGVEFISNRPAALSTRGLLRFSQFFAFDAHPVHPVFEFDWLAVQHLEVLWCCLALVPLGILHAAAGIGGGGVYVVVLILISKLEPYDAVPLSKAVIFIGAVTYSLAVWVYERFIAPKRGKHLSSSTDGVACSLVIPMTLCGTSWGVYFNRFAPDYVIVGGLNAVLLAMTCVVMWQAVKQRMAEDQAANAGRGSVAVSRSQSREALMVKEHGVESCTNSQLIVGVILLILIVLSSVAYYHYEACVGGIAEDCTRFPLQLAGKTNSSKQICKWVLPMPIGLCAGAGLYGGVQAHRKHDWSIGAVITYLATAFGTGIVSGLVGVGGGLIFSPFFVITGMDPAVAVGTSSLCVLFTSSSTTFSYLLTNRVITSLAIVFGLALAPASVAGAAIVQYLRHIPESKSYITFVVAIGIMVSLVCSTIKMGIMVQKFQN